MPSSVVAAVITAAGSSRRMSGKKKEYCDLPPAFENGETLTVLGAAAKAFASCPQIGPIVITIPQGEESAALACLPLELRSCENRIVFVTGGPTRRASVHNALLKLKERNVTHVLIHDGARPWVKVNLIERIITAVMLHGAVIPALALTETPKELDGALNAELATEKNGDVRFIRRHLKRTELCAAQTPQGFKFSGILAAHEKAALKEEAARKIGQVIEYTDDAEVWGEFAGQVAVIPGDSENRKITYPEDI